METGLELASVGAQGVRGDNDMEKPSFINVPKLMFWNAWNKLRGMSKTEA